MTDDRADAPSTPAEPPGAIESRRARANRRILLVGALLSVAAAGVLGALGVSGRGSLVGLFIGLAATVGTAALVVFTTALLDEWRGHRVARRRIVIAIGQLLAVPVLLTLAAGAAGGGA